jgi:GTP cyclohydrolase I
MDQAKVEYYFKLLMEEGLKLDTTDPDLKDTPKRVAKMFVKEFFSGRHGEFDAFSLSPNKKEYNQIVMLDKLGFFIFPTSTLLGLLNQHA